MTTNSIENPSVDDFVLDEEAEIAIFAISKLIGCTMEEARYKYFAFDDSSKRTIKVDLFSQLKAKFPGRQVYYFLDDNYGSTWFSSSSYREFFESPEFEDFNMETYGKYYVMKNCSQNTTSVYLSVLPPEGCEDDVDPPEVEFEAYGVKYGCSDLVREFWFPTEEERTAIKLQYIDWVSSRKPEYAEIVRKSM
jgi:hypothetical protein